MLHNPGLPVPRRYAAIAVISAGVALSVLDGTVVNLALPTLAREFDISPVHGIWIVTAYQLMVAVALLPTAALGDAIGYRRTFLGGLAIFTAASLGCALAQSLGVLVCMRAVQGAGAAGIMSVGSALLRATYPDKLLGRGIGINAMVVAASSAVGPSLSAIILSSVSWRWLFAINVPIGIIALLLGRRALPAGTRATKDFHFASSGLHGLTIGLFVLAMDALGSGPVLPLSLFGLSVAAAMAAGHLRRQVSRSRPVPSPIDLLRIPLIGLSVTTSMCSFVAQSLALIAVPFHLQRGLGMSILETGALMTVWPLSALLVAPIAGMLAERYRAGLLGAIGLLIASCGAWLLSWLTADAPHAYLIGCMMLPGAGFALFQTPNTHTIVHATPADRSGAVGGMISTARVAGQASGAALIGLIFQLFPAPGHSGQVALQVAAVIAIAAAVISASRLSLENSGR